jgi:hypothetical protein
MTDIVNPAGYITITNCKCRVKGEGEGEGGSCKFLVVTKQGKRITVRALRSQVQSWYYIVWPQQAHKPPHPARPGEARRIIESFLLL